MAFCKNCGTKLTDGCAFCPECGTPVEGKNAAADFENKVKSVMDTPDSTGGMEAADIASNKGMAVLSYLGLLFLIPLLAAKDSQYARFHVNQGIVLFIADFILSFVMSMLNWTFFAASVKAVLGLIMLIYWIVGIVNAASGKAKELPLIGKIRIYN